MTTSQVDRAAESSEGTLEAYPTLLEILPTLPSPIASILVESERLLTPPVCPLVIEARPPSPMPVGPSAPNALPPGMVETSVTMAADTSVFQDARLVEGLLNLILLPYDQAERSGRSMDEILARLFLRCSG